MFNGSYYNGIGNSMPRVDSSYMPQQTIQTLGSIQPQVQCFYVNSSEDMGNIQIMPSTVYIGINKSAKEMYIRQWNLDGKIDFERYKLSDGKQEEPELKTIVAKLEAIENRLNGNVAAEQQPAPEVQL